MKIKTNELSNVALDWAVAKCEKIPEDSWYSYFIGEDPFEGPDYGYSTNWSLGGPIIEREKMWLTSAEYCAPSVTPPEGKEWMAKSVSLAPHAPAYGPTPLIAAMRCYVASKLGEEIEIPEELV